MLHLERRRDHLAMNLTYAEQRALEIGLTEIPRRCALAREIRWALKRAPRIRDYRQARAAVDQRYKGMHVVHTINNACLTIWGLTIGGRDVPRVIGETVAMGMDNDCTAATAGSIFGAAYGIKAIPGRWTRPFNNKIIIKLQQTCDTVYFCCLHHLFVVKWREYR